MLAMFFDKYLLEKTKPRWQVMRSGAASAARAFSEIPGPRAWPLGKRLHLSQPPARWRDLLLRSLPVYFSWPWLKVEKVMSGPGRRKQWIGHT
jgi:hypothetical protein